MIWPTVLLCAATSLLSSILLFRGYRRSRVRLLLWSALCFAFLTLDNLLLFVDFRLIPDVDIALIRAPSALLAVSFMVYGLVWDTEG